MASATTVDLLLSASWVIPIEPFGTVLKDTSIAILDGKIVDILPTEEANQKYLPASKEDYPGHAILPGFVNAHTHAAMSLLKGFADDMALMPWLTEKIWPTEARLVTEKSVYDGTLLACREMIRGGITCFNDMYFYPASAAKAVIDSGMRAMIGLIVFDTPSIHTTGADDCLAQAEDMLSRFPAHERISFCLAPHAPYTVSDDSFLKIAALNKKYHRRVTLHLHETMGEIENSLKQHGVRPIDRIDQLGLLDNNLIAVHSTHLNEADIEKMSKANSSVVHCPASNLKLASGIAPITDLLKKDISVALGTDGSASNNRLDILEEMRLASLLAKTQSLDPTSVSAYQALSLATLGGATALGLSDTIGSIIKGKQADLCAVNLSLPEYQPCYNPVSHLVYVCGREAVTGVWISGENQLSVGNLQQALYKTLDNSVAMWQNFVLR